MNYGYIRVSTDKQTVENQRYEINHFCERQQLIIDGWIEETISGAKHYDKRRLGALLAKVGAGDLIICAELSRLGRTLFMIMDILKPSLVQPPLGFVLCFFPTHRTASTTRLGRKITLKTSLFASKTMRNDAKSPRKLELCSCKKTGNTPIGNVLIKRPITT